MRYIGDRHQQSKAFSLAFAIHRIVKVAGSFAVNRDKRQIAQICTAFHIGGGNFFRNFLFQRQHIIWPDVRKIVLAQRNFDFHSRVSIVAKHFGHTGDRFGILSRLRNQVDHHHLAGFGTTVVTGFDKNVLADALIFGHNKQHAAFGKQTANQFGVLAFEYLDNGTLATATTIDTHFAHHDSVTIEHLVHLFWAQKQIVRAVVGNKETKSICMPLHTTRNQIEFFDQAKIAMTIAHHLRLTLHCRQAAREAIHFLTADVEHIDELRHVHWDAGLGEHLENQFPARQRIVVLGLFACLVRIGSASRGVRLIVFLGQNGFRNLLGGQ